jgi:hypothetical protein
LNIVYLDIVAFYPFFRMSGCYDAVMSTLDVTNPRVLVSSQPQSHFIK